MYIPLSFLVMLFRKIKPPHKRSKKLEKILQNNNLDVNNQKMKSSNQNENKKKGFMLPRSFKIVLYLVSFLSMGFSIAFTLFKGEFFLYYATKKILISSFLSYLYNRNRIGRCSSEKLANFFDNNSFNWNFCDSAFSSNRENFSENRFKRIENIFSFIILLKIILMTLLLIVWLRRYNNSQDLTDDDENPSKQNQDNYQVNKNYFENFLPL
jgi:hypothetical protein